MAIFLQLARFRGRFAGNDMTELERLFLFTLLHHGGVCDTRLTAALLNVSERRARDTLLNMLELGTIRRVYIDGIRDPARFFQITAKAARRLGHTGVNAARSGQDSGWLLRGLTRFWFRVRYPAPDGHILHGQQEIAAAFEARDLRLSGTGPGRDRFIETVVSREDGGLEAWSFPAPGRPLQPHVEAVVLRFADSLPTVKLGWVIDTDRAGELARIVSAIAGRNVPFRPLQATRSEQETGRRDALLEAQKQARTAGEKARIQREIDALAAVTVTAERPENPAADPLAAAFMPGIVHDLF